MTEFPPLRPIGGFGHVDGVEGRKFEHGERRFNRLNDLAVLRVYVIGPAANQRGVRQEGGHPRIQHRFGLGACRRLLRRPR